MGCLPQKWGSRIGYEKDKVFMAHGRGFPNGVFDVKNRWGYDKHEHNMSVIKQRCDCKMVIATGGHKNLLKQR